ncbi:hypothetical protein [Caldicellulosiruptor danielii]|uniref:Uncharacterized protein n=1 Tax=Anaerocellum danielii TaxID=1387557 RepID=A0ABZ0U1X9_9FIRM|nr:hypothetical protein [Caldicellulosiruptor danielii]WPX09499.1 hypothetical protein SOJ16_000711 [Caldicellulosiruptor danielii]
MIISKWNTDGQLQWQRIFGGKGDDIPYFLETLKDGGIVVVGTTTSKDGDLKGLAKGDKDAFIIRYDKTGKLMWKSIFGGKKIDEFKMVVESVDGGFIVVGSSNSTDGDLKGLSKGELDALIVKYDRKGKIQWKKTFGGSNVDYFDFVVSTDDKNYVAVGNALSVDKDMKNLKKDTDKYRGDVLITKWDNKGNLLWKRVFGGTVNTVVKYKTGIVMSLSIAMSKGGDARRFTGMSNYVTGNLLLQYDSKGQITNEKFLEKGAETVLLLSDGSFVVGGSYEIDRSKKGIYVYKMDSRFNIQWERCFGGSDVDIFEDIALTEKGNIIVSLSTASQDGDFSQQTQIDIDKKYINAGIIKLDKDGNLIWKKVFGGRNYDSFYSILHCTEKNIIVSGATDSYDGNFGDKIKKNFLYSVPIMVSIEEEIPRNIEFIKSFGGAGEDVFTCAVPLNNSELIVVGYSNSFNGDLKDLRENIPGNTTIGLMLRLNKKGHIIWKKSIYGDEYCLRNKLNCVIKTFDSNFVAIGSVDQYNNRPSYGLIIKFDKDGNILWRKSIGNDIKGHNSSELTAFNSVVETLDGGFVIGGYLFGKAAVLKLNSKGDVEWIKYIHQDSKHGSIEKVAKLKNGNIVAIGWVTAKERDWKGSFGGDYEAYIGLFDLKGNSLWEKLFKGTGDDRFLSVTVTDKDEIFAVGDSSSKDLDMYDVVKKSSHFITDSCPDGIIVKYDSKGNVIWKKIFGGDGKDSFKDIIFNGNILMTVGLSDSNNGDLTDLVDMGLKREWYITAGDIVVVAYNTNGDVIWKTLVSGKRYDKPFKIIQDVGDSYIILGSTSSEDGDFDCINQGLDDAFILKLRLNTQLK